ncbi:MAG: peptidylprolyl isomerase [Anaerolineales bacterium]|nr:peptidylprolyl isomerase [Anaerolineales bacterium]
MSNEPIHPKAHSKKHVARLERERQQTRIAMYAFVGILTAVVALLVYGFLDVNFFQLNKPVAKVNDVEIPASEFEERVRMQRSQMLSTYTTYMQYQQFGMDFSQQLQQIQTYLDTPGSIGKVIVDQLVNEEILRQEAAKRGITVSDAEVEKTMQDDFGYYPNGSPTPTVTPTEFLTPELPAEVFDIVTKTPLTSPTPESTATLLPTLTIDPATTGTVEATVTAPPTATSTPLPTATATAAPTLTVTAGPPPTATPTATPYTLEGFQDVYATQIATFGKFGMDEADYRRLVVTRLLQKKLEDQVITDVKATQEQVWARHILVADGTVAMTIIDKLKVGGDFGDLAKEFSIDTGSAANGGDLGWFGTGRMVPEFDAAVFALEKPGDFTQEPVKSQFGYHIIQLIAKRDVPRTESELQTARDEAFNKWLTDLRKNYTIETYDSFWKQREPQEPSFITMATEIAETSIAAETATFVAQPTATPE